MIQLQRVLYCAALLLWLLQVVLFPTWVGRLYTPDDPRRVYQDAPMWTDSPAVHRVFLHVDPRTFEYLAQELKRADTSAGWRDIRSDT